MKQRKKKLPVLSARAVRVASALALPPVASHVVPIPSGWRGEHRLMLMTGLCRSTVRRALKELTPYLRSRPEVGGHGRRGRPPLLYTLTSSGRRALAVPAVTALAARWRETWPELEAYFKGRPSPVEAPRG